MSTDTHECPRPGCTKRLPAGVYACGRHWFELPLPLRAAIVRTWPPVRRYIYAVIPPADLATAEQAIAQYQAATEAAEQWWDATVVSPGGTLWGS